MTVSEADVLHPHEEALIRAFITRDRQEQFLQRLGDSRTRSKTLGRLYHFHDLDARYAHRVPPREAFVNDIYRVLKEKGTPKFFHVVSGDSEIDGRDVDLKEALEKTVGMGGGTFLSCLAGRLRYFEGEEINERYILER